MFLRPDFRAVDQVRFADHSDYPAAVLDHRQRADVVFDEKLDRRGDVGLGFNGHDIADDHVHCLHGASSTRSVPRRGCLPEMRAAAKGSPCATPQNRLTNKTERRAESVMAAGSVRTHAINRLRTVAHCSPEPLAAIVPATPDDNTCVVETGSPYISAAAIVPAATTSAQAPWP